MSVTTTIDGKTVMLKDIPHTILFTADNGALLRCNIIFPKMYSVENRSRHLFSNYDKSFIKAANKVCSPSVLSRVSKSYRHASSKGIRTVFDDFMYGQDIINVVNEMRKTISSDNTEICG
ncbi:hypothetical protein BDF21DRAFT_222540 [Thamnidium elegans]|nr:hypothetical protein BDF21DRAFT_222540 [Thamnidium elegans]